LIEESEVAPRPIPDDLLPWALAAAGGSRPGPVAGAALAAVAGDASHRRYFRLLLAGTSRIVVESPPATEKNEAFLAVRELLEGAGVRVPALYAADLARGYLLLEDLGDRLLLPALDADSAEAHYRCAFALLLRMAAAGVAAPLPPYDEALLREELARFPAWFAGALLGCEMDTGELALFDALGRQLVDSALAQPQVLVHRDFHSRNLMLQAGGELAVIDFQDAVAGPVTYDLVSLLRDCYICWPRKRVRGWALQYRERLAAAGLPAGASRELFLRWFDWMGLQRHLKVLGTFARLSLRDGKRGYLTDLPLVVAYVVEVLEQYAPQQPAFADFLCWFRERLAPLIARQSWSASA
jgi:aminoglycoside/choline kinase family phosphotransferase